ncbi:MAG: TrpB-like pyridoxal phosphate-dependent enzyme [Candidatus Lernaella stagnicola]|nr:TrpB-like pyridoxal phosphate-dependent enzyme [Candidatus Lernaella stagnicola]
MRPIKYLLHEDQLPTHYYNIVPDLPEPPAPPLHPGTRQPLNPSDLEPLFPMGLIEQEAEVRREIPIPEAVREAYALYRPSPLFRAARLEEALGTPAHIYFKYEGVSPAGSHKTNTAIAQAYYNAQAGVKRLVTETGAGQWGSALSQAANLFGLEVEVYMVNVSYQQKPYRRSMIQTYGASIYASPSNRTASGRAILAAHADSPGSLGIAISEAVEEALADPQARYSLGSVLNHVLLHQTVIGLEAKLQMEMAGEYPDVVIGCHGGGSNFAGLSFPFLRDKFAGRPVRAVAAEPTSCPTLTEGEFRYDFGDTAMLTPLTKMYTLGHEFVPPSIHAGGLRYHGSAPLVSHLLHLGLIEAVAFEQRDVFASALLFARTQGIIPAPEAAHAIHAAVEEAKQAKEAGEPRVILFNLSGHGNFDMSAYDAYLAGNLE